MAAMASLASIALASPHCVAFSGQRPVRRLAQVGACPPLRLTHSRRSFPQRICASHGQSEEKLHGKSEEKSHGKSEVKSHGKAEDKTFKDIRDIIADQLGVKGETISPESKFSDLGADSLDTVEIMMALEEKFNIELPQEEGEKVSTVQNAVDLIKEVIKAK